MRRFIIWMPVCLWMLAGIPAFGQASLPAGFDAYVGRVLATFKVPGVTIAVVKDGKVVLAKGYGVRTLGSSEPVDEHTLFLIASNSKAFTATALSILVEEGRLKWDDPVIDHLPWFRMSDTYVTMHMTVRDLLVHRSGIKAYAGDIMLFPPSTYTRRELVEKLPQIPLVRGFRTEYAYDNILYLAAGEVIKAVSGMEWEDFVRTRILDKIGMNETLSRFSLLRGVSNVASAHGYVDGRVRVMDRYQDQAIGDASDPAGGICTNATDMSKWLITQVDSGMAPSGVRVFAARNTGELWKIVTPMPISQNPSWLSASQMSFWGYALGFRTYNYGAYQIVGHGGKLDGFVSQVAMVPSLRLGIAVLTNQESTGAYWSIIYSLLDHYMHNPTHDWIGGYKRSLDSAEAREARQRVKTSLVADPAARSSLAEDKYAGMYRDTLYGDISILMEEGHLVMRFTKSPVLVADLQHFQHDTWIARFRVRSLKADCYVNFALKADGSIDQAKLQIIDPDSDLSFEDLLLKRLN